jgi:hypothetical protein
MVNTNNTIEEIKERISAGNKAYFAHKMIFMGKTFSRKSELKLYNSARSIATQASVAWAWRKDTSFLKENYPKDLWAYR